MRVWRTSSIISGSLMPCPTQRKGRSKKNWTSCSDKNENSRIKFRFWSSYFSVCDETYTCVCTSKCNTEICKTKCNGGVAFTFANEAGMVFTSERLLFSFVDIIMGYEDPYYFSRCFKKQYGVPPSKYRTTHDNWEG